MSIGGKLKKWTEAGLITESQRDAILDHERKFAGGRWRMGLASAGILSVLLGISLIVAANWQDIPNTLKFWAHATINASLVCALWKWRADEAKKIHREVALFFLWGLTLTFIALIGQIFQTDGQAYQAVRLWFWLTTPMILLFAQGTYLARLWSVAFVVYVPYDIISATWDATQNWDIRKSMLLGTALLLPLATWALGMWPRFVASRDAFASVLRRLAVFTALFFASAAGLEFYDGFSYGYSAFVPLFFAGTAIGLRFAVHKYVPLSNDDRLTVDLLCLSGLFVTIPFLSYAESDVWAVLHFIAYWVLAGSLWQQQGNTKAVNIAVTMVSIRLFVGFLEIFGGLMLSGFGFIGIGLVLMSLGWATRKVQKRLNGDVS